MPRIEPVVFAQIMMLPPALREDLLECVGATNMGERQVEELLDRVRHDFARDQRKTQAERAAADL